MSVQRTLGIVMLSVAAAVCGSSSTTKPADSVSTTSATAAPTTATTGAVNKPTEEAAPSLSITQTNLQKVISNPEGYALYSFATDGVNGTESKCNAGCSTIWPPVIVTGTPNAGNSSAKKVGTIKRADGTLQITINGRPAYTYAGDTKPGAMNGQNVGGVWFMFDELGDPITTVPPEKVRIIPTTQPTPTT